MADPRTQYRSAFRGSRAPGNQPGSASISYPVSPRMSRGRGRGVFNPSPPQANVQVQALQPESAEPASAPTDIWQLLPKEMQQAFSTMYGGAGFEGLAQSPGWYDMPEYVRRKIMEGARG